MLTIILFFIGFILVGAISGAIWYKAGDKEGFDRGYDLATKLCETDNDYKKEFEPVVHACKICGFKFNIKKEDIYQARDARSTGVIAAFNSTEGNIYEAIDCPLCTCQNILSERKRKIDVREVTTNLLEGEEE